MSAISGRESLCNDTTTYYLVEFIPDSPESCEIESEISNYNVIGPDDLLSPIISSRLLVDGSDVKTTVELMLGIEEYNLNYLPGDTVSIYPKNPPDEVTKLLELMLLNDEKDTGLKISVNEAVKKKPTPQKLPLKCTPQTLLESVIEIRGVIKKAFLRSLVNSTSSEEEKRRLQELSNGPSYTDYFLTQGKTLIDVLELFPSCKPTLSLLLEHLPRLQPRVYSIASSPLEHPNSIRIIFNVVTTPGGRPGVCSGWLYRICLPFFDVAEQLEQLSLATVEEQHRVRFFMRKQSKFRVPEDPASNWLMIGPGTGVAPFIGFLEHKKHLSSSTERIATLLFGCRHKGKDELYKERIKYFLEENILSQYHVCYSREPDDGSSCKYVQDIFYKKNEEFCDLLMKENTYLFICGDARNMTKDVHEVIIKSLSESKGLTMDEAQNCLKEKESEGKYVKDVWR